MVLGITGGVGCGKSTLLSMLEKKKGAKVILADNLGHEVMEPGTECYEQIVALLGSSILDSLLTAKIPPFGRIQMLCQRL